MSPPIKFHPDETWTRILDLMVSGMSLSAILRLPGMPSYSLCKLQLRADPDLRARYDEAVEDRADALAEQVEAIADEEIPTDLDGPGKSAWIARQRLRFDARRWASSKLSPRRYGDKVLVDVEPRIDLREAMAEGTRRALEGRGRTIEGEVITQRLEPS
jgi:hypothetical protein